VASSCLRSFQMVSSFARGAVCESLEAVRVAVWRRGGWRLIATGKVISSEAREGHLSSSRAGLASEAARIRLDSPGNISYVILLPSSWRRRS